MKCRVRRNRGFRPVNVRLRLDSPLELAVLKAITVLSVSIPEAIAEEAVLIQRFAGIEGLSKDDIKACVSGMLNRINNKLPEEAG